MSMLDTNTTLAQVRGRTTRGRVPIYRPLLNGENFDILVTEAAFNFAEGKHDALVINASSPTLIDTEGINNQPISFFFGGAPRSELFNGYVVEVGEQESGAGALSFTLLVMGPTKPMQTGTPHFWTNKTIPAAVQDCAYRSDLGFHGHEHPYIWPALAQTSESDWQIATTLAERMGWRVYSRYGVVGCYDPLKLLTDNGPFTQLVSGDYSGNQDFIDAPERSLLEFEPKEEKVDKVFGSGVEAGYFDGTTEQIARQQGDFTTWRMQTDKVLRNSTEAGIYIDSETHSPGMWDQQATARLMGNSQLYPGMSVEVLTSNARYYRNRFNGRWLIRTVQHKMDRQSFQTMLTLARPESKLPISTTPHEPFWLQAGRAKPTMSLYSPGQTGDTLMESRWKSSWGLR